MRNRSLPGLAVAALIAAATLAGCGTNTEPKADSSTATSEAASPEPETITVDIRVSWLSDLALEIDPFEEAAPVMGPCTGAFDAVKEGSPVVLQDSSGQTIAEGKVGAGTIGDYDSPGSMPCLFPITLEDVPAGQSQYALKVGNVDPVYVTEDELARSGTIIELVDGT